jgi:hypothetical protein
MKRRAVNSALRWMLAAWTLWAFVLACPTVVHSHLGGENPHQHDPSDCVPDAHSYPFAPEALLSGHGGGLCLSAADFHQHGCLPLLGAVKYLPMPTEPCGLRCKAPCGLHCKAPCGWPLAVVAATAQGRRACSSAVTGDHLQLASPVDLSGECIGRSGQREIPAVGAAPSAPLCDRARHERSGVLLA